MKNTTFAKDKKRRIKCPSCCRFLKESRLMDNKVVEKKCPECGSLVNIVPPTKLDKDGKNVINYGIGMEKLHGGMFTADETDKID